MQFSTMPWNSPTMTEAPLKRCNLVQYVTGLCWVLFHEVCVVVRLLPLYTQLLLTPVLPRQTSYVYC
jgi:hypothetical protein